jgi:hypothetical protein
MTMPDIEAIKLEVQADLLDEIHALRHQRRVAIHILVRTAERLRLEHDKDAKELLSDIGTYLNCYASEF